MKIFIIIFAFNFVQSFDYPPFNNIESAQSPWEAPEFEEINKILSESSQSVEFTPTSRIINGSSVADLDQFPHHVLLILLGSDQKQYICGGSIIRSDWILTAAHCLYSKVLGLVIAGSIDVHNGPIAYATTFNASDMIIHEAYSSKNAILNDIGLIQLRKSIPCDKHVGFVDLPCDCDVLADLDGVDVTVAGYGLTSSNATMASYTLNYASFKVMPNCECQLSMPFFIPDSILCTDTSNRKSTCLGDSGSGLIAEIHGRKIIVGIVSFGLSLNGRICSYGPNGYTRVASFRNWIRNMVGLY